MQILLEPRRTAWDLGWSMLSIPVRVNPLFWLTALFLSYYEHIPFLYVLIGIACIFVSVLVHEFGHALSGIRYGARHPRVILYSMGGLCVSEHELHRWPRISMLLWGPGAGFVLAAIAYVVGGVLMGWSWISGDITASINLYVYHMLYEFFWINVSWGILNLMPVFPLDGGQITREWVRWKLPARGERLAFTISFYAAIVLAIAALAWKMYLNSSDPRSFMPVFMFGWLAYQSWSLRRQIELYGDFGGADEGPRQPWEQDADWWKNR